LGLLPPAGHRFLFGQSEGFLLAHLVLRALFGAVSGTGEKEEEPTRAVFYSFLVL